MEATSAQEFKIVNTTRGDLPSIAHLFDQAMSLQGKNGYIVWNGIDQSALHQDIDRGLQYKIIQGSDILCLFSVQYSDPFIWRDRDQNDAIYLHRVVVNPEFKGKRQFEKVVRWATQFAKDNALKYVRMDTWADNRKIIDYYLTFGFRFVENYHTGDEPALPVQNRNLDVALLELAV